MTTHTLYRAADTDTLTGPACFARRAADARAYLDNPGFGGTSLFRATIEVEDEQVLDIRSESQDAQLEALVEACGIDMGSVTADWMVMQERTAEALREHGYRWVRLLDTYPEGAETWVYLYDGDDPEMELVE